MEELLVLEKELRTKLKAGKTSVTLHNIHLRSALNDLGYVTSVHGKVHYFHTELDETNNVLSITLDVCIFPFNKYVRSELPLFKNMLNDPTSTRSIYIDGNNKVHARIAYEITDAMNLIHGSLNIPGVFLGTKCKPTCYRRCFVHSVERPYIFAL